MLIRNSILAGCLTLASSSLALGAVSADKAAQLGRNLTLVAWPTPALVGPPTAFIPVLPVK